MRLQIVPNSCLVYYVIMIIACHGSESQLWVLSFFLFLVSPKIQNNSHCTVEGELLVCVCFSRGNPPPPITWPLKTLTDYSVSSSSSLQTVSSTITVPATNYHNTTVKCISSNEIGQAETEIVIQNSTANFQLNCECFIWSNSYCVVSCWSPEK